jgi:hypothetical protein
MKFHREELYVGLQRGASVGGHFGHLQRGGAGVAFFGGLKWQLEEERHLFDLTVLLYQVEPH